jgi:hypothetical protein
MAKWRNSSFLDMRKVDMLKFDMALQQQLIFAVLDDFSANDCLPSLHCGQYGDTPTIWRDAVIEFLGDSLAAGLIAPLASGDGYASKTPQEICDMLRLGDLSNGLDAELVWDVIHFSGTEKLVTMLRGLGLATWEARSASLSPALKTALTQLRLVGE